MDKRHFLQAAMVGATAAAAPSHAQHAPGAVAGPILLTVSGLIGTGNRGALDRFDPMMAKQGISFGKAHAFDFAALVSLPVVSIRPTLEYDLRRHALKGPLLAEVMKACGAQATDRTLLHVRAVDGYAVVLPWPEIVGRRFIVATHFDGSPMALGGLGPLWTVYDTDTFPDMAARPVAERFGSCPWATYHIDVRDA